MVTTRSADKRANHSKEDLVLRAKATATPGSITPTPTALSRKRTVNSRDYSNGPGQKRSRIDLDGANGAGEESDRASDAGAAQDDRVPQATATDTEDLHEDFSHESRVKQVQVIIPPLPESTPKAAKSSIRHSTEAEPNSARSNATSQAYLTPRPISHKHFDSQEPEDDSMIVINPPGTDSSAHQEYETAEEEIPDSDEAPDVETTKVPSSRPSHKAAGRTPRGRKAIASTDDTKVVAGVGIAVVEARVDAHDHETTTDKVVPDITDHAGEPTNATTDTSTAGVDAKQQLTPPPKADVDIHDTVTIPRTTSAPPNVHFPPLPTAFSTTDLFTTTEPQGSPSQPITTLPSNITRLDTESEKPSTLSPRYLRDNDDRSASAPKLPKKKTTTLNDHRRALLERRAERSGGAFKLEVNWSKKRAAFAA